MDTVRNLTNISKFQKKMLWTLSDWYFCQAFGHDPPSDFDTPQWLCEAPLPNLPKVESPEDQIEFYKILLNWIFTSHADWMTRNDIRLESKPNFYIGSDSESHNSVAAYEIVPLVTFTNETPVNNSYIPAETHYYEIDEVSPYANASAPPMDDYEDPYDAEVQIAQLDETDPTYSAVYKRTPHSP
jgi:hypothetical protein